MSRRASILGRLRRLKTGAARYVVAAFGLAYLTAGVAPCATAASQGVGDPLAVVRADGDHAHAAHAHHAHRADSGHDNHGSAVHDDPVPAMPDHGEHQCPHCPAGAGMAQSADHSSCFVLEDLTSVAASQAKDAPQTLLHSFSSAVFTLPPPLASPAAPLPSRAAAIPPVPLNVRHCVFLI